MKLNLTLFASQIPILQSIIPAISFLLFDLVSTVAQIRGTLEILLRNGLFFLFVELLDLVLDPLLRLRRARRQKNNLPSPDPGREGGCKWTKKLIFRLGQ